MRKESTESRSESRPEWEQLEDWVRSQVQRLIQELLEEEVTVSGKGEVGAQIRLGLRYRLSERTAEPGGFQFGNDTARESAIPRSVESRLLPLFVNRTRKVAELNCTSVIRRRLRSGFAGAAGRGRTGIGEHGGPVEVQVER